MSQLTLFSFFRRPNKDVGKVAACDREDVRGDGEADSRAEAPPEKRVCERVADNLEADESLPLTAEPRR